MDPEPGQVGPSKNHQLFYNPQDPENTMVMLKNIEHMGYFHGDYFHDDGTGKQVYKFFPNYFILNNIQVAHKQKHILHAMLNQKTDPQIMINKFCQLARTCYPSSHSDIERLESDFKKKQFTVNDILKQYTKESFFYRLLNRLLRAGKDSTEMYYAQHFTKLVSTSIKQAYRQKKKYRQKQVAGSFRCYRGAYFSDKQLEELRNNVGRHIETLGFLSTSIDPSIAENFLQNGNTMVEILVSDSPRDEELDLGYAYLSSDCSTQSYEKQVLFNVLSSFQIESIEKFNYQGREVWNIQLKYGVTYQMMHNYKQNKLIRGTAEQQQILAILSYQNTFKRYKYQEDCLLAVDEYIWMVKTKIKLCKRIPKLQKTAERKQFDLYFRLTTDDRFKGKEQKYAKEIEPKYLSSINFKSNHQTGQILMQNMRNIFNQIENHQCNCNQDYESFRQLVKKWRQLKQHLLSDTQFQFYATIDPQMIETLEQIQTQVLVRQAMVNIEFWDKKEDIQKLKQQIKSAQRLQQQLFKKYHRYHPLYLGLKRRCIIYAFKHGLISFEAVLQHLQQPLTFLNSVQVNQEYIQDKKLFQVWKQANRCIQQKQWAEAVKLCAEFRDKHYKGREHQDQHCFKPIMCKLNKKNTKMVEKLQILQACLSIKHPKHSALHKKAESASIHYKQHQLQCQQLYMNNLHEAIAWPAKKQLVALFSIQQKEGLPSFEPKGTMLWIAIQYLTVNALRMVGRYQDAKKQAEKLKQQHSATKHPQFLRQLMKMFDN